MVSTEGKGNRGNGAIIGIAVVVIVLIIGFGAWSYSKKVEDVLGAPTPPTAPSSGPDTGTTSPVTRPTTKGTSTTPVVVPKIPVSMLLYKNGTYTATGSYFAPSGSEKIGVTLVLKDDLVTDSILTLSAVNPQTRRYQQMFADNYKTFVVGKNINQVHLTRVSGSSLTSSGFNDAVTKIKAQAKA
jgi:uncharacterized protein with FMN-binding domain